MMLQCVCACVHTCPLVLQNIAVPLNGDMDAIKKYAEEMQKIKKQVSLHFPMKSIWLSDASACAANSQICITWSSVQAGALDPVEVADARMEYDLECSGYNVRQFLGTISGQGTLGEFGHAVMKDLLELVTEIEQETDAVLDAENEEGWEMFQERVAVSLDLLRVTVVCAIPGVHTVCSHMKARQP